MITYIKEDSIQNAEAVRKKVLGLINELPKNPERYKADRYKKGNDANFRAFEIYHFRIAYYIEAEAIRIVRIRSTHQEPLDY